MTDLLDVEEFAERRQYLGILAKSADYTIREHAHDQLADLDRMAAAGLVKVGPKGYVHGWIYVGAPGAGTKVVHPEFGHGTVRRSDGTHTHVLFDSGKMRSFQHSKGGKPGEHFIRRADHEAAGAAKPKAPKPTRELKEPKAGGHKWDRIGKVDGDKVIPHEHAGISRKDMPQLAGAATAGTESERIAGGAGKFADLRGHFEQHLKRQGIKVTHEHVPVTSIKASQNEINRTKVGGMADAVRSGDERAAASMRKPIFVSREGHVIDGHHKWAAGMLLDDGKGSQRLNVHRVDLPTHEALEQARQFSDKMGIGRRSVGEMHGAGVAEAAAKEPDKAVHAPGAHTGPLSDKEFEDRQKYVEKTIGEAAKTHATDVTHMKDGVWDPERDRIHREIADHLYARAAHVKNEGKAVVAGGLGGAGKTTILTGHAGINPHDYLTVNPDDIKEELAARGLIPEVPGHPDLQPMERAALVHEESSRIGQMLADKAYADRKNMIWDITMSSGGSVQKRLDALKKNGYDNVRGVFVHIPAETSVDRAMARYRAGVDAYHQGEGFGGRFVPPSVIRAAKTSGGSTINREVFDGMKDQFHDWSVYDNSGDFNPQLVEAKGKVKSWRR